MSPLADGMGVGFQVGDLDSLIHHLHELAGVESVFLSVPTEDQASLYITVKGLSEESLKWRSGVYQEVEAFLAERESDIHAARFSFDYYILVADGNGLITHLQAAGAEEVG